MTRYIILMALLYAVPAFAQQPLILENIILDNEDRDFFGTEIISATSSAKPVVIIGTSKVEFLAKSRIYMGPGFSTSDLVGDAQFHAYIDDGTNSIDKVNEHSPNLLIAPNPNDGYFTLSTKDERILQLTVMDMLGRTVYEQKNLSSDKEELHLENLQVGIYFVKVLTDKDNYISKVEKK